jgi:hypothetical protein
MLGMKLIELEKYSCGMGIILQGKKYHLVSWNVVCKSKSQGGLGVLDLKIMNTVLLAKWMVRF